MAGVKPLNSPLAILRNNGYSAAIMWNNNYIRAGERPDYYRSRGGVGSIDARAGESMPGTGPGTGKTSIPMGRGFGGLNNFWMLQNKNIPAFQNPHAGVNWGLGNSAQEMGARMAQAGNMLLSDGRYVPDTMFTRTMGSAPPATASQNQGPNPDQMRWAQAFANTQPAASPASTTPFTTGLINDALRTNFVQQNPIAANARGELNKGTPTPTPTDFSRAALIEGAKKSGEFNDIMNAYNRDAAGTGFRMNEQGNIVGRSTYAQDLLNQRNAARDLARGEEPVQKRLDGTLVKANPYGTATAGGPGAFAMGDATMKDHMGRVVPMNQYLTDQSAVQRTKVDTEGRRLPQGQFNEFGESFFTAKPQSAKLGSAPLDSTAAQRIRRLIRNGGVA